MIASANRLEIGLENVNVNGGAVALGHPLAGSGLRLVLTLAYELRRRGGGSASRRCAAAGGRARRSCCGHPKRWSATLRLRDVADVLVIGAGPYGLAAAKAARDKGLSTAIVGRHMAFWREHMPAGMLPAQPGRTGTSTTRTS